MVLGIDVNNVAVLVAGVVSMIIGSLWYGPLFGKTWMKLSGITKQQIEKSKKKGMGKSYLMGFVLSLITAYVLAGVVGLTGANTFASAALVGFWVWLGFSATHLFSGVLWEGKSTKLFWLSAICHLITLIAVASIIALW